MRNQRGSSAIILVICFSVMAMFSVIGADVGVIIYEKAKLSNTIDAASLAGAQALPQAPDEARALVSQYLGANGFDWTNATVTITEDNRSITVDGFKEMNTFFGPLIGKESVTITESVTVMVGPIFEVRSGVRPLVIEQQPLQYGDIVDLKLNAKTNYKGNFGAVSLGGTGASNYEQNLLYGFKGSIKIGDIIYTETGNKVSVINPLKNHLSVDFSTFDSFSRNSDRLWVIPVVDEMQVEGKYPVTVVGFAEFFIEEIGNQSGQTSLKGRFIKYTGSGTIDDNAPDYGLYGIKIMR